MAIDKSMLAMMLMSSAPSLLQTLKNTVSPSTFNKANDLITNRQYDAPLIGKSISQNISSINPNNSNLISNNLLDSAAGITMDSMLNSNIMPSSGATDLDLYNLGTQIKAGIPVKGTPALDSAAAMLLNGLPTDEQIPNPNTRMSPLDWAYADLEQMPNTTAKHELAKNLAKRSRQSYGLTDFFNANFRK